MSQNDLVRLRSTLDSRPDFARDLAELGSNPLSRRRWLREKGYDVTADELSLLTSEELSEDELEAVAGGWDEGGDPPPNGGG